MGTKNLYACISKELEVHTAKTTTSVLVGRGVTYGGAQVSTPGGLARGIAKQGTVLGAKEEIPIVTLGTAIAQAGATISALGAPLAFDAQGRLVPATAGQNIFARSVDTAVVDDYFEVEITREGVTA